jgi:glucose/arabinose dehydrogenase
MLMLTSPTHLASSHRPARRHALLCAVCAAVLQACASNARLPVSAGLGSHPTLPEPDRELIPRVHVAEGIGWPAGAAPSPAPGLRVQAFATGLDHPRWLQVLPNGDVLVAETNAPPRPEESKGIRARFMKLFMKKAGAGTPSANRITLLRDTDGDGAADVRRVFIEGLNSPFGMALVGDDFYVADTDAVLRFPYARGQESITVPGQKLVDLPAGPRNHHWTKSLAASPDGRKLYATVGSNSNAAEHGIEIEEGRAAIWEIDRATGAHRIFASGIRNANGMAFEPRTGALWCVANERDEIGGDLVPDYLTSVTDGGFYGWPYSYYGQHVDERAQPQRPDLVARAIVPDYALGSHTASLGLAYSDGGAQLRQFGAGMFVGQHGSWNRKPRSGYKVVFVPFRDGRPAGDPVDVLTGFLDDEAGVAYGRPVGVALDRQGALLVADDVGNAIWRLVRE